WNGFIWALDTVATVGSVPSPDSTGGQLVKVALIILGVGTLFYALVTVTEMFVSGHLASLLSERRMQKLIDATEDHFIICGFGRVGRQVARDLKAAGARYVVVDSNPESREYAQGVGVRFIEGEPSDDDALRAAGRSSSASGMRRASSIPSPPPRPSCAPVTSSWRWAPCGRWTASRVCSRHGRRHHAAAKGRERPAPGSRRRSEARALRTDPDLKRPYGAREVNRRREHQCSSEMGTCPASRAGSTRVSPIRRPRSPSTAACSDGNSRM